MTISKFTQIVFARGDVLALIVACLTLYGCSSVTVKSNEAEPLIQPSEVINEAELLDVGVLLFDPGLESLEDDKYLITTGEIRLAESRYFANQLNSALINSGAWGSVRIVPPDTSVFDLTVFGHILRSDGEKLEVKVRATDSSNRVWLEKVYKDTASKFSYENRENRNKEPFQNLFNRIANDLLAYRNSLPGQELQRLRTISELQFGNKFAPQIYSSYLTTDKKGQVQLAGLPSRDDPYIRRIEAIRERDYLFVDTLQDHYGLFNRSIAPAYREWRRASYYEVIALNETRRNARNNLIVGVATVVVGAVAGATSDSRAGRTAGAVAASAGGLLVLRGINQQGDVDIHIDALRELADSLQAEVEPQVIELENRTVTLSGTVEDQYQQWRDILERLFTEEQGAAGSQIN